jgi:hypothetical protein
MQSVQGTLSYQGANGVTIGLVTVTGSAASGEFCLPQGSSCTQANGSCTFSVSFAPIATGMRTGSATL